MFFFPVGGRFQFFFWVLLGFFQEKRPSNPWCYEQNRKNQPCLVITVPETSTNYSLVASVGWLQIIYMKNGYVHPLSYMVCFRVSGGCLVAVSWNRELSLPSCLLFLDCHQLIGHLYLFFWKTSTPEVFQSGNKRNTNYKVDLFQFPFSLDDFINGSLRGGSSRFQKVRSFLPNLKRLKVLTRTGDQSRVVSKVQLSNETKPKLFIWGI